MKQNGKDLTAVITGCIVLVAFVLYSLLPFSESDGGRIISGTLSIILRIFSCIWISYIAKNQGRKPIGYVLLGIFFPAITLIIIGLLGNNEPSLKEVKN